MVDNLPPQLLDNLLIVTHQSKEGIKKTAVTIDVRETEFLALFPGKWLELDDSKYNKKVIFLDASINSQLIVIRKLSDVILSMMAAGLGLRSS